MAKLKTPRGKLVRKFGENIFGNNKYDRLLNRKPYAPGQHGQNRRRRLSNYGSQLHEKQKIKIMYGLLEKQFRSYFAKADQMKGETGTNLMELLERRLDNVVYRLGFATSRPQARQMVNHAHFLVNDRRVNIPSYLVKAEDIIEIRDKSKELTMIAGALVSKEREVPDYIKMDEKNKKATFIRVPKFSEIPYPSIMQPSLVIEYYSR